MSIGNLKDYGNKGNNFPFQLKVLQSLNDLPPKPVTPVILVETSAGQLIDECTSICFANIGTVDISLSFAAGDGAVRIPPGISINMDAGDNNDYYEKDIFYWEADRFGPGKLLITYNKRPQ